MGFPILPGVALGHTSHESTRAHVTTWHWDTAGVCTCTLLRVVARLRGHYMALLENGRYAKMPICATICQPWIQQEGPGMKHVPRQACSPRSTAALVRSGHANRHAQVATWKCQDAAGARTDRSCMCCHTAVLGQELMRLGVLLTSEGGAGKQQTIRRCREGARAQAGTVASACGGVRGGRHEQACQ